MISLPNQRLPFLRSSTHHYWCYNCRRFFNKIYIEGHPLECPICQSGMVEETNSSSSPQNFLPFNSDNNEEGMMLIQTPYSAYLEEIVTDLINLNYENEEIERIINYLIIHDQNKYGSPPASKEVVSKLKEEEVNDDTIRIVKPQIFYDGDLAYIVTEYMGTSLQEFAYDRSKEFSIEIDTLFDLLDLFLSRGVFYGVNSNS